MRGWGGLYRTSVALGLWQLAKGRYVRPALVRIVVPLDPSRYLELPWALRTLAAQRGERVLDLASPKLLAVALARQGVDVMSVDELPSEIETWRALAGNLPKLRFEVADGRALPFADESFDHAYSLSVLEHIADDGDREALRELARVVRAGGRVLVTVPYAREYREDWRERPAFVDHGDVGGRYFFQRWYDEERLEQLIASALNIELVSREVVRMQPNWNEAYVRLFPLLLPMGPLFGLLARERVGPGGDVARLTFTRRA